VHRVGFHFSGTLVKNFTGSFIQNIHPERTAVSICDGATTHIGVGLTEKERKEHLILKLPPHASHFLQPTNRIVYRPLELKCEWDETLIKWQRRNYSLAQKFQFGAII
jgi:hypothetical protein